MTVETATPPGQPYSNATLFELQRTGAPFTARVKALRDRRAAAVAKMERIPRTRPAGGFDLGTFGTQYEADKTLEAAIHAWHKPQLDEQAAIISDIDYELAELGQARTREVHDIRARMVVGSDFAAIDVVDWRTPDFLALGKQIDALAAELSQVDGALVDLADTAKAATAKARAVAVAIKTGERTPAASVAVERAVVDAEAALAEGQERSRVLEEAITRLEQKRDDMQARLESEWRAARLAELQASTAAIVTHLRAAMAEHARTFMPLHVALFHQNDRFGPTHPSPLPAIDATDEYAACRMWIESVQRLGWIDADAEPTTASRVRQAAKVVGAVIAILMVG